MDSVTQGILGGAIAQLGFRQRLGKDATWVGVGAAVLPDMDILIVPVLDLFGAELGPLGGEVIHRSYSHSLLVAPLMALPVTLAWWALRRRAKRPASFWLLYLLVFLAVVSQPLLDVCTSYGTQILLPFDDYRYALNAVPIVDIIYTPVLILTLLACYVLRKLRGEERSRRATTVIGWAGMLLGTAYLGAGLHARDAAIERGREAMAAEQVERIEAYPTIPTILVWRVVAKVPDGWVAARVHMLGESLRQQRIGDGAGPWVERAGALPAAETFRWFTDDMVRFAESDPGDGGRVVELHDMRYAARPDGTESLWKLRVTVGPDGEVTETVFQHVREERESMGEFARGVWRDTWNP